jgi:predicted CoA-binding protein
MREHGYVIVPVNPKLDVVDGLTAHPDLEAVSQAGLTIDIVNLFRASENVEAHVDEVLRMQPRPRAVWMQLGIHHGPSAKRLRDAGIEVVQDRCIMVDHRRLAARLNDDTPSEA